MQLLGYLLIYPFLKFISLMPFRVLYFLSDIAYVIVYRVLKYRTKTVRYNMGIALPHLTKKEQRTVEKKFYRHFCDTFFEMIKSLSISDEQIAQRFTFSNIDVLLEFEGRGKSIVLLCAHYSSYEWLLTMNRYFKTHVGVGIYKTIRNKYFDKLVRTMRLRFRTELIDTKKVVPYMRDKERKGIKALYGFISDQSPKIDKATYWGKFFGAEVPVHIGGELLAKKFDMNVLFVKSGKIKRGHYTAEFIPFEGNVRETPNFKITDIFLKILEDQIVNAPEFYLWTHKRFKHMRPAQQPPATSGTTL